jgi:hypothetical protein
MTEPEALPAAAPEAPAMGPDELSYRTTAVALLNRANGITRMLSSTVMPRQVDPVRLMLEMQLNTMRAVALLMDEMIELRWGSRSISHTPPSPAGGNGADAPRLVVP